jgi:drug/metabolite transporter (DMT)-like permease
MTQLPPPVAPLRVPPAVILGLVAAIVLDTAVQMLWKHIVLAIPASDGLAQTLLAAAGQPTAWILLALFLAQFFCWMIVLAKADLSFVQPITSLSFVTVAVCAVFFFPGREHLGPMRAVGIVLILLGVRFISQTDHRTAPLGGHRTPNPSPLGEGGPSGPGEGLRPTISQSSADRLEEEK